MSNPLTLLARINALFKSSYCFHAMATFVGKGCLKLRPGLLQVGVRGSHAGLIRESDVAKAKSTTTIPRTRLLLNKKV